MGARTPQELHDLFATHLNDGDVDGLASLYEDDAVLVAAPGQTVAGREAVREALTNLVAFKGKITFSAGEVVFESGELALSHATWTMTLPDGNSMEASTAEIARRGSDGTWRYVIDNPFGTAVLGA